MRKFNSNEIKKILCIKPRGIGDIVLSTIILDNLIAYFPGVKIDYLTEYFAKDAVDNNPLINKLLTMERTEFPLKVAYRIRKEKYNLILDLWSNPRSAQITFLSRVKYRVGFGYRGRKYAYNILATSDRGAHHSAEHNLELLHALSIPVHSKIIHYYISQEDDNFGKDFIKNNFSDNAAIIGIVPSGGWESKRCDSSKWVEICKAISAKFKSKFLILWGPGDEDDANYIKNHLSDLSILAPRTSVKRMSGLIKNCSMIIANDSGPMHISAALGIPTLGLFGPTDPKTHGPYSENSAYVINENLFCRICNLQKCLYKHECFNDMSLDIIVEKVSLLLEKSEKAIASNEKA
ncbi:MAG: glycosyltransferase family 9 protein [Bacteroidetes bacterium]|nr:glycosyltransferase family 9 protein [Bacteroidota bacterium]